MEALLIYLLNASAGIVLFYAVYWLFLRNETFHNANRWFLIASLFMAVALPLFPLHYKILVEDAGTKQGFQTIADTFKHIPVFTDVDDETSFSLSWKQVVAIIYFTGAAIFLLRLLIQSFVLIHLMIKHGVKSLDGVHIIENEKYGLPFSFFNLVFVNPKFHTQDDLPEILAHEKVHIRENHWFDLLFIELLTVIFWFNPFIWFFERSIKQNHEYLADKGVLAQGHTVARYQALLVNQLMGMQIIGITNNLNFALNANRLKMMTKKKTSRILGIKFVWALPVLALLLFAFAEPEYRAKNTKTDNISVMSANSDKGENMTIHGKVIRMDTKEPLPGASIVIKGTTVGTVVDKDGTFTLVNPNPAVNSDGSLSSEVVVSFVGLKTVVNTLTVSGSQKSTDFTFLMEGMVSLLYNKDYSGEQQMSPPPPPPKVINEPANGTTPPPPPPTKANGEEEVFYIVEDWPKYPGDWAAKDEYVSKMQQKIAQSKGIKGKAKVTFTVDAKGKVTDIKVVEKDNDGAAKGAVALVSGMPDWTPGKQRGKPVPVKFLLPVEFK